MDMAMNILDKKHFWIICQVLGWVTVPRQPSSRWNDIRCNLQCIRNVFTALTFSIYFFFILQPYSILPSIFHSCFLQHSRVAGACWSLSQQWKGEGRVYPGRVASSSQGTLIPKWIKCIYSLRILHTTLHNDIPGAPGCIEHKGVLNQLIREARYPREHLATLWLDPTIAYG